MISRLRYLTNSVIILGLGMFVSGCSVGLGQQIKPDISCGMLEIVTVTQSEIEDLTEETSEMIDNNNVVIESLCGR